MASRKGISGMACMITFALCCLTSLCAQQVHAEAESPDSIVRVGACATPGVTWGVYLQGNFAYVADRDRITIVSVFDPSNPWVVSDLPSPYTGALGVCVRDTLAYLHAVDMHTIVSVADSSAPYRVGWCFIPNFSGMEPKGISVADTISYLTDGDRGLQMLNTARLDSPRIIGAYDTPGIAVDLYVEDTLAYIADLDSLQIVNVADSSNLYRVGACSMPNPCYDVIVAETLAYVTCQSSSGTDGTLQVVNVSDVSNPYIIDSVAMNGDPWAVYVVGNYAYVAAADYHASKTGQKRQVGGLRAHGLPAPSADVKGGLRVVDVSNPDTSILIASYDTPGDPRDLFVVDTLVYIADYDSLQILKHIVTGIGESSVDSPRIAASNLTQNVPNPFVRLTAIRYRVSSLGHVSLMIYDTAGRLIRDLVDEKQEAGYYTVTWVGTDGEGNRVSTGIYFYRLQAGDVTRTRKMVLMR